MLVWVKVVTTEFMTSDPADRVDKVGPVKVLKPVLVRVMSIGATIEIVGRRVFLTFLVTCVLGLSSVHV